MPLALRFIRLDRWDTEALLAQSWVPEGDIVADVLRDVGTTNGTLSVWHIADDKSNLNRVLAAFGATRDKVANLDYLLIEQGLLQIAGVEMLVTAGTTVDPEANSQWHRELVHLSGHRLVELVHTMLTRGETCGIEHKTIADMMRVALQRGNLDGSKVKKGITKGLEKLQLGQ